MTHIAKYGPFEKEFMSHSGLLAAGNELHGINTVFKFGHNDTIGTSFAIVASDAIYRAPTPANAVNIRIKAGGHANDTVAGIGGQQITIEGLDSTGAVAVETLDTAGALASAATSTLWMRVYRAYVSRTGNYTTSMIGNGHYADIVLESTAGQAWALIEKDDVAHSQTQIGAFSFGLGQRGYLVDIKMFVESNKVVDFILVSRSQILTVTAGIQPHRLVAEFKGTEGSTSEVFGKPLFFRELTDVAVLARVGTGTAAVSAQMTIVTNINPGE